MRFWGQHEQFFSIIRNAFFWGDDFYISGGKIAAAVIVYCYYKRVVKAELQFTNYCSSVLSKKNFLMIIDVIYVPELLKHKSGNIFCEPLFLS